MVRHYLNNIVIQEPIGFDKLKMVIKRGEFHGISAEVSEQELEFYGEAAALIRSAYKKDIDTEIIYRVTSNEKEVYNGILDLSTYEEQTSAYCSVSCKVGEVGVKTTFNNRVKTEVDIDGTTTIEGLDKEQAKFTEINIPLKHLKYINLLQTSKDTTYKLTLNAKVNSQIIPVLPDVNVNGYGNIGADIAVKAGIKKNISPHDSATWWDYATYNLVTYDKMSFFYQGDGFSEKFGKNTQHVYIEFNITVDGKFISNSWFPEVDDYTSTEGGGTIHVYTSGSRGYAVGLALIDETGNIIETGGFTQTSEEGMGFRGYLNCRLTNVDTNRRLFVVLMITHGFMYQTEPSNSNYPVFKEPYNSADEIEFIIKKGSYIKMEMWDNLQNVYSPAQMISVHDALNAITRAISEKNITVKSDWYGRTNSQFNKVARSGRGGNRYLSNGYKIRGIFADGENQRNMPLSFSQLLDALRAIDCVGWGFIKEDNQLFIRVEQWSWFYKDDILMHIEAPTEIRRNMESNSVCTKFTIGYDKYEISDTINSIDSIHGKRTFVSKIKAISNPVEAICKFVADNYAIELTRRARTDVAADEEYEYDEKVFIFETDGNVVSRPLPDNSNNSHIERPTEQINVGLSPRRCANRWATYLFQANSHSPLRFSTGEINYKAHLSFREYGDTFVSELSENADIDYHHSKLCAETISFTYPLSVADYQAIKANPYGLIEVDGIFGWIKEFTYSFADGEATFKLIPKTN